MAPVRAGVQGVLTGMFVMYRASLLPQDPMASQDTGVIEKPQFVDVDAGSSQL